MELEYQDPKRRAKIIVALGLVLAIVAGGGAFLLITNAQEQAGQASLTRVAIVVAKVQIPARKALSLDDVEVREVPVDGTNAEGVFSSPAAVVGLIPSVTILAGQPIYANMLASQTQGGQFSILEPGETVGPDSPAWRAVSLTVPDDRAVGGQLQPGDTVDVFTTILVTIPDDLATEGRYFTDRSTKITYQNLVVLARSTTFYVLRVPATSAEEINHIQATGSGAFSFALRPAADARLVDASRLGATTNLILQRYGLPIPEVWPPGNGPIPTPLPTPTPAPSPAASSSPAP